MSRHSADRERCKLAAVELRKLPKVDRIVSAPQLSELSERVGRRVVTAIARDVIGRLRSEVKAGSSVPTDDEVVRRVAREVERRSRLGLGRVVNATGVVLHTNLGRAPLSRAALERIFELCGGYVSLELDVESGSRTRRGLSAEARMARLVGAEDALLVNNNAAAVLLALSTIAAGRDVIVSRGELVEIGGGFRIPEVLARSGARLVEVGTTNRTRVNDYARAIGASTACLLRVHPSNFRITGFAERPELSELAALARERELPLIKDLGGGLVVPLPEVASGAEREPSVQACLAAGVDLVCFSLDKLFGGPQGGVVAGSSRWVSLLREDPLARALRVDKLTLAALETVLDAYERDAASELPVFLLLRAPLEELRARAEAWRAALHPHPAEVISSVAAIGGGTLAEAPVESWALRVPCDDPEDANRRLRAALAPVLARIEDGAVVLDVRTVFPGEDGEVIRALQSAFGGGRSARSDGVS